MSPIPEAHLPGNPARCGQCALLADSARILQVEHARRKKFLCTFKRQSLNLTTACYYPYEDGSCRAPQQQVAATHGSMRLCASQSQSILVTTPAATVRLPSRTANRSPGSSATGVMSSKLAVTLSPGITISTLSGSVTVPVDAPTAGFERAVFEVLECFADGITISMHSGSLTVPARAPTAALEFKVQCYSFFARGITISTLSSSVTAPVPCCA